MQEIFDIVKEIGPKSIVPVHTNYPDLFESVGPKTIIPKIGEKIELK